MKRYIGILLSAAIISANTSFVSAYENTDFNNNAVNVSSFKAFIKNIKSSETTTQTVTEATTQIVTEATTQIVTEATTQIVTEATTQIVTEATTQATTQTVKETMTESTTQVVTENTTQTTTQTEPKTDKVAVVKDIAFNKEKNLFSVPSGYYVSENLKAHLDRLNKNLKPKIVIKIDSIEKPVSAADIASFTDINTGAIDYNKVWSYCGKIMDTYNTLPYSRKFKTHDGVIVNVPVGDYGWKVDMTGLTKNLYQSLINFKDNVFSFKSSKSAFSGGQTVYGNDIGNTYIEIDLTNQTVHWFKNGVCVLSDYCVTGKKSTPTPAGTWSLKCNTGRTQLTGPTWNVWVNYWAHFTQGCGLHDATWQPSFGLARWKAGHGSHGCVNLSSGTAKKAHQIMQIGEPVVVYYR